MPCLGHIHVSKGMGFGDFKLALGIGWLPRMVKGIAVTPGLLIGAIVGVAFAFISIKKYGPKSSIKLGGHL